MGAAFLSQGGNGDCGAGCSEQEAGEQASQAGIGDDLRYWAALAKVQDFYALHKFPVSFIPFIKAVPIHCLTIYAILF